MDKAIPNSEREAILQALESLRTQGCDYHLLRTRQAGRKHFADVHILVPGTMSVKDGHDLVERVVSDIAQRAPMVEMMVHMEPLEDPHSWDDPKNPLAGS